MSALAFQTVLARMLASPAFLARVQADADGALAPYALTREERAQLAALPMRRVGQVARSLVAGKVSFLLSGVPFALRRLLPAEVLEAALRRFLDVHPGRGLHPYDEGLRFLLCWLDEELGRAESLPLWAREAVRFERLRVEVALSPLPRPSLGRPLAEARLVRHPGWRVERFHFDVPALLSARTPQERAPLLESHEQWWLLQRASPVTLLPAHPVLGAIATLADGTRTGSELVAEVARAFAQDAHLQPDVEGAVREAVEELALQEGCLIEVLST